MSKKIDPSKVKELIGTQYPAPYDEPVRARGKRKLGDEAGLTQFGVNLLRLEPGVWSAQRHWHKLEDEFIYVLEGEVVLVTDSGEETLSAGDAAGFKAGEEDGHHLQNRSDKEALVLEVGTRTHNDVVQYPEADLVARMDGKPAMFTRRDGTPYKA
ncbi:MAG: cupin domain-containing protein [Alphaproteobacteria bacterium]|nr:cupin domain-containing protein [Alphaproteobacteria bacterium]